MLNHPSQGSDDAQDEKQGDFPVIEEEITVTFHIGCMFDRYGLCLQARSVFREVFQVNVCLRVNSHQGQKLGYGGLGVDDMDLDAVEAVIIGYQRSQTAHMVCVKMGEDHVNCGYAVQVFLSVERIKDGLPAV